MTKEEAIKILADLTDNLFLHTWEEQHKALQMAIEALSAEPQTDLISRADAICEVLVNDGIDNIVDRINDLPSAELPKGELISKADVIDEICKGVWNVHELVDRINALPSTRLPEGDLISRQWLLEVYGDYIGDNGEPKYYVPLSVVRQNIKDAPSPNAVSREWYEDAVKANHELAFNDLPDIPRYHYEKVVGKMAHEINMLKEQLESADAEWILCSERLPIPPTFCLVTTDGSHGDVIDIALYMSDGWHKASEVIAWMPLPKPYKGGDEE